MFLASLTNGSPDIQYGKIRAEMVKYGWNSSSGRFKQLDYQLVTHQSIVLSILIAKKKMLVYVWPKTDARFKIEWVPSTEDINNLSFV